MANSNRPPRRLKPIPPAAPTAAQAAPQPQLQPQPAPQAVLPAPTAAQPQQDKPRRTCGCYCIDPNLWVATLTSWRPTGSAEDTHYLLRQVDTQFGGIAFRVQKVTDQPAAERPEYDLHLGGAAPLRDCCTCPGFVYTGHCKHLSAVQVLIARGKLPGPPSVPTVPAPILPDFDDL